MLHNAARGNLQNNFRIMVLIVQTDLVVEDDVWPENRRSTLRFCFCWTLLFPVDFVFSSKSPLDAFANAVANHSRNSKPKILFMFWRYRPVAEEQFCCLVADRNHRHEQWNQSREREMFPANSDAIFQTTWAIEPIGTRWRSTESNNATPTRYYILSTIATIEIVASPIPSGCWFLCVVLADNEASPQTKTHYNSKHRGDTMITCIEQPAPDQQNVTHLP